MNTHLLSALDVIRSMPIWEPGLAEIDTQPVADGATEIIVKPWPERHLQEAACQLTSAGLPTKVYTSARGRSSLILARRKRA